MIVYKITNKENNKAYIGQTIRKFYVRWNRHTGDAQNGSNYKFHRAIRKYGKNCFKWDILRICDCVEELNDWEQYYIIYYDSMNSGYNGTSGGLNCGVSDETRQTLSKIMKEKWQDPDFRKSRPDMSGKNNPNYGKKHSKRRKIAKSNAMKLKWQDPEYRDMMVALDNPRNKGQKHSSDTRKKQSDAKKGKSFTKEHKDNLSKARKRWCKENPDKVLENHKLTKLYEEL